MAPPSRFARQSGNRLRGWPWDIVRALELSLTDYVVFGSAPLLAHGLITEIGDIDILAVGTAWRQVQTLAAVKTAPGGDGVVQVTPELSVFNGWLGLDAHAVIDRAELWDGLPVAQLDDVAAYKRRLKRPKDDVHLKLLEPYLIKASRRQ